MAPIGPGSWRWVSGSCSLLLALAIFPSALRGQCLDRERQKLTAADGTPEISFGSAVAVRSDVAVVGDRDDRNGNLQTGSAHVYRFDGQHWWEEQKLNASDGAELDAFGAGVAVGKNMIAVGAPGRDEGVVDGGAVYVFRFDGTRWQEVQKLLASDRQDQDQLGAPLAMDGGVLIASASEGAKRPYAFRFDGSQWREEQKFETTGPVALDRGVAVIGRRVFRFDGSGWTLEQKLAADDAEPDDRFGASVAVSDDVIAVGADGVGTDWGAVYVFRFDGRQWFQQQKLLASDGQPGDHFGISVTVRGGVLVGGASRGARRATTRVRPTCSATMVRLDRAQGAGAERPRGRAARSASGAERKGRARRRVRSLRLPGHALARGLTSSMRPSSRSRQRRRSCTPATRSPSPPSAKRRETPRCSPWLRSMARRCSCSAVSGRFGADHAWHLGARVPAGLAGHTVVFQSFARGLADLPASSNREGVSFQ
jgi:hypothetical protein